jgi:hypothetical protein
MEREHLKVSYTHRIVRAMLWNRILIMGVGGAVALGIGSMAFASLPHASGVVHACKGKNGALRIAKTCGSGETAVGITGRH